MTESDYAALLQHIAERMGDPSLVALHTEVMRGMPPPPTKQSELALEYLVRLEEEMRLQACTVVPNILRLVNSSPTADQANQIRGIRVRLSDSDKELYHSDDVDLIPAPGMEGVLQALGALRVDLQLEMDDRGLQR
jgi:hypothetical protein